MHSYAPGTTATVGHSGKEIRRKKIPIIMSNILISSRIGFAIVQMITLCQPANMCGRKCHRLVLHEYTGLSGNSGCQVWGFPVASACRKMRLISCGETRRSDVGSVAQSAEPSSKPGSARPGSTASIAEGSPLSPPATPTCQRTGWASKSPYLDSWTRIEAARWGPPTRKLRQGNTVHRSGASMNRPIASPPRNASTG